MMTPYQQYIAKSRYARWLPEKQRRETWEETVDRLIDFWVARFPQYTSQLRDWVRPAILYLDVMPSMRSLMTAGPALERENLAGYNCAYLAVNEESAFAEALYVLMCGTGVGFSCERQEIAELPVVPENIEYRPTMHVIVEDSKEGWATAYETLVRCLYQGYHPQFDFSLIRPAGAPLKTFGGRASGPEPLRRLFDFTIKAFTGAKGRRLNSLEVHDIMCMIGEVVVVGGVRRSALISLSNLSDDRMRTAKSGAWWTDHGHRALANNSAVYTERPSSEIFLKEWLSLIESKSGERGIFNREAAKKQAARWGRRSPDFDYGCNPCSEILLRDKQLCNLTEVVVCPWDDELTLAEKVSIASFLGTLQSTLTNFNFVSGKWKENTEEERLLGVSLTGVYDNPLTYTVGPDTEAMLCRLRDTARITNRRVATELGIPESAAITCVKPSGTVSQLCDAASGIHPRHAKHYLRTTRVDKKDPMYEFLRTSGLYIEDDVLRPADTAVVYFPQTAPEGAMTRDDVTAMQHLKLWLMYQRHWCEHKPSVTISVKDDEWPMVGAWVWAHFDECSGISFLPHSDHTYQQAPYQEITEEQMVEWLAEHPQPQALDWAELDAIEDADYTEGVQTLACAGGMCEI